jgi:hypothetical protein
MLLLLLLYHLRLVVVVLRASSGSSYKDTSCWVLQVDQDYSFLLCIHNVVYQKSKHIHIQKYKYSRFTYMSVKLVSSE